MYRRNDSNLEEEEEDAKRTRDSFLRSILYPQQQQQQQQQQQDPSRAHASTDMFRRPPAVQPSASSSSQGSFPVIPQVSPHHLEEVRMVPLHALPTDQRPPTPQRQRRARDSSQYSPIAHPYATSYRQGPAYEYLPSEMEGYEGIEIVTPDQIYRQRRGYQMMHTTHEQTRKREYSDFSSAGRYMEHRRDPEPQKELVSNPDVVCNCAKSRCLKLYCDCFQNGDLCNTFCKCLHCLNTSAESIPGGRLYNAKRNYMRRKPDAFGKKVKKKTEVCSCKNNKCLKKYCLCFRSGVSCTEKCTCVDCENRSVNEIRSKSSEDLDKKRAAKG